MMTMLKGFAAVKQASSIGTSASKYRTSAAEYRPGVLGIWRLGQMLHRSETAELTLAQPADAHGSPRWDYVIKRAVGPQVELEGRQQVSRFIAAATSVSHPNLAAVLDGSVSAAAPYLVMPRLEGRTMGRMLADHDCQPLAVALWLVRQTAQGLASLHSAGWVHGDLKPANLIVGETGHVTLIDLSFASPSHTPFGPVFRGTPDYAAPELLEGRLAALPAMDLFALGRVLWRWLTNLQPVEEQLLEPVAGLVESMVDPTPERRPTAAQVASELLRLEIETLGSHIGPGKRAA